VFQSALRRAGFPPSRPTCSRMSSNAPQRSLARRIRDLVFRLLFPQWSPRPFRGARMCALFSAIESGHSLSLSGPTTAVVRCPRDRRPRPSWRSMPALCRYLLNRVSTRALGLPALGCSDCARCPRCVSSLSPIAVRSTRATRSVRCLREICVRSSRSSLVAAIEAYLYAD